MYRNRILYEDIKRAFELRGCKAVTKKEEYQNIKSTFAWICHCGEEQKGSLSARTRAIKDDSLPINCRKCSIQKTAMGGVDGYVSFCEMLEKEGWKMISPRREYGNDKTSMVVMDNCGNEMVTTRNRFKSGHRSKKIVDAEKAFSQEEVEEGFRRKGHTLLDKYVNRTTQMRYLCGICKEERMVNYDVLMHRTTDNCEDCKKYGRGIYFDDYVPKQKFRYCDYDGCEYHTYKIVNLRRHLVEEHDDEVEWTCVGDQKKYGDQKIVYECDIFDCDKKYASQKALTKHRKQKHLLETPRLYYCARVDCEKRFKNLDGLERHDQSVHENNPVYYYCDQQCEYYCRDIQTLRFHFEATHNIGKYQCDFCTLNRNAVSKYKDQYGCHYICRKCYRNVTGMNSRIEHQMSDYLDEHIGTDYLIGSDESFRRIGGMLCQKYRPDKLYASPRIAIHIECDEKQHQGNGSYSCDEKRITDIHEEFDPGMKLIVIRWNPDTFRHPKGTQYNKIKREDRLRLLVKLFKAVQLNPPKGKIHVYYMFYSQNNPYIVKRIKHTHIYSTEDIDKLVIR